MGAIESSRVASLIHDLEEGGSASGRSTGPPKQDGGSDRCDGSRFGN